MSKRRKLNYTFEPSMSDLVSKNGSGMLPTKNMKVSTTFSPAIWEGLSAASEQFKIQKSEIIRRAVADALKALQ